MLSTTGLTTGTAFAVNVNIVTQNNGGYTVTPGNIASSNMLSIMPLTVQGSIAPGQINWVYKNVNSFIKTLNVDLNWGKPSNSLQLTVYSPDGYTFGPYYDNADGKVDGQINININNPNGIAQGTWIAKIYGYSVSGTQSYII